MKKNIWTIALMTTLSLASQAQPLIIGHRGFSAVAPENTLASIHAALQLDPQPSYVEIDLYRSSDGILIVSHDSNTLRTTGVNHIIRETPFEELRQLDAGYASQFKDQFKGEKIPYLEEVLDAVKDTPVGVMIECKQLLLENQVIHTLRQRGELQKHVLASFDEMTIYRSKEIEPSLRTLYLVNNINDEILGRARDLRADIIGVNNQEKPENVRKAQEAGFKVWIWTVDKPEEITQRIHEKVDGIITNQSKLALQILQQSK